MITHPWVVVVPYIWKSSAEKLNKAEVIEFLHKKPFVRNLNINPDRSLNFSPQTIGELGADGVIGIRSAVICGAGWSVLPAMSVHKYLKEKKLIKVDLETHINDEVSVWWIRSRKDLSETAKIISKWVANFKVE